MNQRTCGECFACCSAAEVKFETYTKPARKTCKHVLPPEPKQLGRCGIHGQPCRPSVCGTFTCAWLNGVGAVDDRPDKSGVMLSVNDLNGGRWGFVIELEPGAFYGRGASVVARFARELPFPVIVTTHDREPGRDTGNLVVLKDELLPRAKRLIGAELAILEEGVKVYELYDHHKGGIA